MKKKLAARFDRVFIVWTLCILILAVASVFSVRRLLHVLPKESFEQKITNSALRQGDWFMRNQKESGDFIYEQIAATGEIKEGDNIVRQAGALYGLAQLYRYNKEPNLKETLEKGFGYFRSLTATISAETSAITLNDETWTNTTALLVLGLTEFIDSDTQLRTTGNLEYLVRLSNYLIATQTSTGAYINDYDPEPTESDYNNGETMYALIRSYSVTQKPQYLASVKHMAEYAMNYYGSQKFNSSFFSWGMAAFAHLYTVEKNDAYWRFMSAYAQKYFDSRGNAYEQYLAHQSKSVITPGSSVFLEGVDHIAWIAKEKDPLLYQELKRHIERVLNYLLVYEIDSPYGKYAVGKDSIRNAVCSQVTCETTRIDFLQHNMSAILLYKRLVR